MNRAFSAIGRVAALPTRAEPRLAVAWEHHLLLGACPPESPRGLAPGDLVSFTWQPPDRFAALARLGAPVRPVPVEEGDAWRWRRPGASAARMSRLRLRHRIVAAIRAWFDREGFIEVETPALVRAPSPEPQFAPVRAGGEFLITSPEFQMKRMLVGGFEKIVRLGPVFRSGEVGRLHNPEFTLLEWYRVGEGLEALARDLEALLAALLPLAQSSDGRSLDGAGRLIVPPDPFHAGALGPAALDCRPPFPRRSVAALFRERLAMAIEDAADAPALRAAARAAGVPGAEDLPEEFEEAFFALWNRFEQLLGREAPLLVVDWPAPLASLARLKPEDPRVAERMEWMLGGIEVANGFAELTDAAEQRSRFERDRAQRRARGLPEVPLDERFLSALAEGMPPAAGMALGVDRLVMLLAGATHIAEVLPFTWDER